MHRGRARIAAPAAVALLVAWPIGGASAQADCPNADANVGADTAALEDALTCLIANDRAAGGIGAVTPEDHLRAAARDHAAEMITRGYFGPDSPTGESPTARAVRFGYGNGALGLKVGAVVAYGGDQLATPRSIFNSLKANASQFSVLRDPGFANIGAGAVRGAPAAGAGDNPVTYAVYFGAVAQAALPVAGKTVGAEVLSGAVGVMQPGNSGFTPLTGVNTIAVGSRLDTRSGRLRISAAGGAQGIQKGDFGGGVFTVTQAGGPAPVANLKLPQPRACKGKRTLRADAAGRFRTIGKYASATATGASWITQDTCSGTKISVAHGVVKVKDKRSGKTRTLRAGRSLLVHRKRKP